MKSILVFTVIIALGAASFNSLQNKEFQGFGSYYYPVGHYKINPYCDAVGRYLPHPTDRCIYLRCDYGKEPWYDVYGNIRYYALPLRCPAGTSVSLSRYPKEGDTNYSPAFGPHEHPCVPEEGLLCTER